MNNKKVIIELDGNEWCAHREDFKNIQESVCGFGETERKALTELIDNEENKYRNLMRQQYNY